MAILIVVRAVQFIPHDNDACLRQEGAVQRAAENQAACKRE
jgi:hypothetical protein